jgi:hypothetical protein
METDDFKLVVAMVSVSVVSTVLAVWAVFAF